MYLQIIMKLLGSWVEHEHSSCLTNSRPLNLYTFSPIVSNVRNFFQKPFSLMKKFHGDCKYESFSTEFIHAISLSNS
jgi:hypothetical protein